MKNFKKVCSLLIAITLIVLMSSCGENKVTLERHNEKYECYQFDNVVMKQTGVFTFDIDFSIDTNEELDFYLTKTDYLSDSDIPLRVNKVSDGNYSFSNKMNLNSEYFLWAQGTDKYAFLPITIPSMFPKLEKKVNSTDYMFTFGFTGGVSWSSFCDPAGKSVYYSTKSTFDKDAVLIKDNISIIDETCDISNSDYSEDYYYYSVITSKNGLLKIISNPILLKDRFESDILDVTMALETSKAKKPLLQLKVTMNEGSPFVEDSSKLEFVIKNATGNEVLSSKATKTPDGYRMNIDISKLNEEGTWYDLCLAYDGILYHDIKATNSQGDNIYDQETLINDNSFYTFKIWSNYLKIMFGHYGSKFLEESSISLNDTGAPCLTFNCVVKDGYIGAPMLAICLDGKIVMTSVGELNEDGSYTIKMDLNNRKLDVANAWYDIRVYFGGVYGELEKSSSISLKDFSVTNSDYNNRKYSFKEYGGLLKIMYENIK